MLGRSKITPENIFKADDKVSRIPGFLQNFKLLKAFSSSLSLKLLICCTVSEKFLNYLKSLSVVGIEDVSLGPISVKILLNPLPFSYKTSFYQITNNLLCHYHFLKYFVQNSFWRPRVVHTLKKGFCFRLLLKYIIK